MDRGMCILREWCKQKVGVSPSGSLEHWARGAGWNSSEGSRVLGSETGRCPL